MGCFCCPASMCFAVYGLSLLALLGCLETQAWAQITVTPVKATENTETGWKGTAPANANITIMVENNKIVGGFSTYTTKADAAGKWEFHAPADDVSSFKDNGQVIISSPGQKNVITKVAAIFMPSQNTTITALTVQPGSTAASPGGAFALTGKFTTKDTNVVYDSSSPDFGDLSGLLLASDFKITGIGTLGTLRLALNSDQPYEVNLLPAWDSPDLGGTSVSFSGIDMAGLATLNPLTSPFTGTVDGTIMFLDNNMESTTFNFDLSTRFGSVTGTVNALGTSELVPEPPMFLELIMGLLAVFASCHRVLRART